MAPFSWVAGVGIVVAIAGCGSSDHSDREGPPRRVVVISLDTLRADHLGSYGYERPTSPALDRFAQEGVVFERAYAQATWTLPSHMSLLTGLYPDSHGVVHDEHRLADEVPTLAEVLQDRGFETAAFTDNGFVAGSFGFSDGFDTYDDHVAVADPDAVKGLERTLPLIDRWLDGHADDDFFLFVHTFDVHGPYQAPEELEREWRENAADGSWGDEGPYLRSLRLLDYLQLEQYRSLEDLIADYDAGIRHTDGLVERLFDQLRARGLYEGSLIVVTSDHGESFFEDGFYVGHGVQLSEAEMHIPLLVKFPDGRFEGRRVEEIVEMIDVMPTILETMGVSETQHPPMQGRSLRPLLLGEDSEWSSVAFASHAYAQTWCLRTPQWTLISPIEPWIARGYVIPHLKAENPEALFERLPKDYQLYRAGEWPTPNLAGEQPQRVEALKKQLLRWKRSEIRFRQQVARAVERRDFHEWEIDYLRRLGYLGPKED